MRRNYLRRHTCRLKKSLFATAENAVSKKQSICDGTIYRLKKQSICDGSICCLKKWEYLRRYLVPSQMLCFFETANDAVANTLFFWVVIFCRRKKWLSGFFLVNIFKILNIFFRCTLLRCIYKIKKLWKNIFKNQ